MIRNRNGWPKPDALWSIATWFAHKSNHKSTRSWSIQGETHTRAQDNGIKNLMTLAIIIIWLDCIIICRELDLTPKKNKVEGVELGHSEMWVIMGLVAQFLRWPLTSFGWSESILWAHNIGPATGPSLSLPKQNSVTGEFKGNHHFGN